MSSNVEIVVRVTSATEWAVDTKGVEESLYGEFENAPVFPDIEVDDGDWATPEYVRLGSVNGESIEVEAELTFEGADLTDEEKEAITEKVAETFVWPTVLVTCTAEVHVVPGGRQWARRVNRSYDYKVEWAPDGEGLHATYFPCNP